MSAITRGEPRATASRSARGGARGTTISLVIFAAAYASTLLLAPDVRWALASAGAGLLVAGGAWLIGRRSRRGPRHPTTSQARAVGMSAAAEGVVLVTAVVGGLILQTWWFVLPVMLVAVTVHIACMAVAYRRGVDAWALVWVLVATVLAWILSPVSTVLAWPLAGALAAGMCLGYVLVARARRPRS